MHQGCRRSNPCGSTLDPCYSAENADSLEKSKKKLDNGDYVEVFTDNFDSMMEGLEELVFRFPKTALQDPVDWKNTCASTKNSSI